MTILPPTEKSCSSEALVGGVGNTLAATPASIGKLEYFEELKNLIFDTYFWNSKNTCIFHSLFCLIFFWNSKNKYS